MSNSTVPDREFLHIHIHASGAVYIFADNGHWEHSKVAGSDEEWRAEQRVTFAQLDKECCVGDLNSERDTMFRIPLKRVRHCKGKFGLPFDMEL